MAGIETPPSAVVPHVHGKATTPTFRRALEGGLFGANYEQPDVEPQDMER